MVPKVFAQRARIYRSTTEWNEVVALIYNYSVRSSSPSRVFVQSLKVGIARAEERCEIEARDLKKYIRSINDV